MWKKLWDFIEEFHICMKWHVWVCDRLPNIFFIASYQVEVATIVKHTGQFNAHSRFDSKREKKNHFVDTHIFVSSSSSSSASCISLCFFSLFGSSEVNESRHFFAVLFALLVISSSLLLSSSSLSRVIILLLYLFPLDICFLSSSRAQTEPNNIELEIRVRVRVSTQIELKIESSETVA